MADMTHTKQALCGTICLLFFGAVSLIASYNVFSYSFALSAIFGVIGVLLVFYGIIGIVALLLFDRIEVGPKREQE